MNCPEWAERIATDDRDAAVGRHLAECEECGEFAAEIREGLALLRGFHAEPIAAAHYAAVRARTLGQVRAEQRRRVQRWGLAVAALTALALIALYRPPAPVPPRSSSPPAEHVALVPKPLPPPAHRVLPRRARRPAPPQLTSTESFTVKIVTDDPNVVIYWIVEKSGD